MARTPEEEAALTTIATERIKTDAKAVARQARDDKIDTAQAIYTAARKVADDAYDVDVAALDAGTVEK